MTFVFACLVATLGTTAQEPPAQLPVSLERIREELAKPPAARTKFDTPLQPVAKFRSGVDQRVYVLTLEEWIAKEFKLTALQRQSFAWGAKCCGFNLLPIFKGLDAALDRRKARKIREKTRKEIRRKLALIEEARKLQIAPPKTRRRAA